MIAGCGLDVEPPFGPCPSTVTEAGAVEHGRELYLATGHVIRFIPADDPEFRGYDVNLQARDGEPYHNTVLVRTQDRIPGITDGQPVLLVGERTDGTSAIREGDCPALVPIPEADVAAPWAPESRTSPGAIVQP
jgi:hypothetical protein